MERIPCGYKECGLMHLRPLTESFRCSLCDNLFCISHRNPEDHDCTVLMCQRTAYDAAIERRETFIRRLRDRGQQNTQPETNSFSSVSAASPLGSDELKTADGNEKKTSLAGSCLTDATVTSVAAIANTRERKNENTKRVLERIKLRTLCTGDNEISTYNRLHLRITLSSGLQRHDRMGQPRAPVVLPSRQRPIHTSSKVDLAPSNEICVWFDKTRTIGWHLDFLCRHFKLSSPGYDNVRPFLALCREFQSSVEESIGKTNQDTPKQMTSISPQHKAAECFEDGESDVILMLRETPNDQKT